MSCGLRIYGFCCGLYLLSGLFIGVVIAFLNSSSAVREVLKVISYLPFLLASFFAFACNKLSNSQKPIYTNLRLYNLWFYKMFLNDEVGFLFHLPIQG